MTTEVEELRAELYVRFAGWTFQGYVQGAFRMADGTQALNVSAAYMLAVEEDRPEELEQLLRDFKNKTRQEAIYLEIQREVEIRLIQ